MNFRFKLNLYRSSHQRCSIEIVVLKNFHKIHTRNHLCRSVFFNKVAALRPVTLLKRRLWHRCFPVNFVKFLRTPFLQNTSGRLLLLIETVEDDSLAFIPIYICLYLSFYMLCFTRHCCANVFSCLTT